MRDDPIVAEIHRIREKIAASFNYDLDAFFADLMKRQEELGDRLIRLKKPAELPVVVDASRGSISTGTTSVEPTPAT